MCLKARLQCRSFELHMYICCSLQGLSAWRGINHQVLLWPGGALLALCDPTIVSKQLTQTITLEIHPQWTKCVPYHMWIRQNVCLPPCTRLRCSFPSNRVARILQAPPRSLLTTGSKRRQFIFAIASSERRKQNWFLFGVFWRRCAPVMVVNPRYGCGKNKQRDVNCWLLFNTKKKNQEKFS